MKNPEIAKIFRDIAQILEIKGENVFRIRAYERAAQNIEGLERDIEEYAEQDRLTQIPGIGKDLAGKIQEFLDTGKVRFFEDLKKEIPDEQLQLLEIPSVGPKTAKLLIERLKIKNISGLEDAIKAGKLSGIEGIKEKTVENILKGISIVKRGKERMNLAKAMQVAGGFVSRLQGIPGPKKIIPAGSLRRRKETVRDIDILVASPHPEKAIDCFVNTPGVAEITARGETKASVRNSMGIQVDCRVVSEDSFGAALLYFTGSKDFNIKLRQLAMKKGWKVNEYGVFDKDSLLAGKTEEEIFRLFGMQYIEPELRENTGEIELALENKLPRLVELKEIRGDLHTHSTWSDGADSIAKMAGAAAKLGYSYIAITDHSQGLKIAGGLSIAELKLKRKEIEELNKKTKGLRILFGTEVDIGSGGELDYPEKILRDFDIVIAAIHSGFRQSRKQLTRRIVKACQNKHVHIIAHPTGRLFGTRDAYDIDMEEVLKAARESGTAMEINSFPDRLDLNDTHCRLAKDHGVRIAVNTDSHATEHLSAISLGLSVARRGWLTSKDILNTLPLDELLKTIRK